MELGTYNFEGQLHNGRPYYVMRGQPKTYYMYWNNSEKNLVDRRKFDKQQSFDENAIELKFEMSR